MTKHLVLAMVAVALFVACGSNPATPVPPDSPGGPAVPDAPATNYRITGLVDDGNSPIAGALITVESSAGRDITRTDSAGVYVAENVPYANAFGGMVGAIGVVSASAPGYWNTLQAIPSGTSSDVTRNLRLRRVVGINTGDLVVLTMDANSSLIGAVIDEDYGTTRWELRTVEERFIVNNVEAGRLFVSADDGDDHSGYPNIYACRIIPGGCLDVGWATRTHSFNISGGEQFEISVRVPPRPDAPRRYTVKTFRTP